MANRKRTNNDPLNITQKTKDHAMGLLQVLRKAVHAPLVAPVKLTKWKHDDRQLF